MTASGEHSKNKRKMAIVSRCHLPAFFTIYIIYVNVFTMHLLNAITLKNCATTNVPVRPAVINNMNLALPRMDPRYSYDDEGTATTNVTLVVYAGPSTPESHPFTKLYIKNFEFFLRNGVECDSHDTVIVVAREYYAAYLPWIRRLDRQCKQAGSRGRTNDGRVILVSRRRDCYDMEAAHLTLYGGVSGLRDIASYDYFVFVNCGVTGPAPPSANRPAPWTSHFTGLLDDRVKMTGLSMNCKLVDAIHIQSMAYAVDKIGLALIMESGAIFDCLEKPHMNAQFYIIKNYEQKMGRTILDAGYALRPMIGGADMIITKSNLRDCVPCEFYNLKENHVDAVVDVRGLTPGCDVRNRYRDIWMESRLMTIFNGEVPSLDDVIFFKTSRLLPPDIAAQINYTEKIHWKWT